VVVVVMVVVVVVVLMVVVLTRARTHFGRGGPDLGLWRGVEFSPGGEMYVGQLQRVVKTDVKNIQI